MDLLPSDIAGLPLHPLVVHAAVVFGPLSALGAIAYVVLPRYRDLLRWPVLAVVLIAFGAIWAAYLSGESFLDSDRFAGVSGELAERIEKHEDLAGTLRWITTVFAGVVGAATYFHARTGAVRTALGGSVVVLAVLTLVWTVLTGDAGARSVWGS